MLSGGKVPQTPYQQSKLPKDWDPALDRPLDIVLSDFQSDACSIFVPLGVVLLKFADVLRALDWHLYHGNGDVTEAYAQEKVKWAAEMTDKKFTMRYERLPQ